MSQGEKSVKHRIAHSTGILAFGIGLSRLLGFIRDVLMARLFGATLQAEAFIVAFRLPNLMRDLVAEGAVTSAFVPVLSWYKAKSTPDDFWRLNAALLTKLSTFLVVLGALGVVLSPYIVRMVAPGFVADPEKFALTVRLTRVLFPFITLVGWWAYFMGLLNTLRHFAIPSLGPAILNVAMIIACLYFAPNVSDGILAVAASVIIGGVIQLVIQFPPAIRRGLRLRMGWEHPGSAEVLRLLGPRIIGAAVYQISVLVDTAFASLSAIVGAGAVAALYYSNRLVQLPLAMFGNTFAQASLPSLAEQASADDFRGFHGTLLSVIRMVVFVILPASAGLIVLAFPIVSVLFERGAFDHRASVMTSQALIYYSLGLLAYSVSNVLTGAFYALRNTKTPVRFSVEALLVNVAFSLLLMWPMKVSGLALAAAISNTYNAWRLMHGMQQRLGFSLFSPLTRTLWRTVAAVCGMALGCRLIWQAWACHVASSAGLAVTIGGGVLLYAIFCASLRVPEFFSLLRWIKSPLLRGCGGA